MRGCLKLLTVEVLSVELLNELKHHAVYRPLIQHISRRETLGPGSLSTLVLGSDSHLELLDRIQHNRIIEIGSVHHGDDISSFVFPVSPKQVTRRLGEEEDSREEDETPEHLQPDRNSP